MSRVDHVKAAVCCGYREEVTDNERERRVRARVNFGLCDARPRDIKAGGDVWPGDQARNYMRDGCGFANTRFQNRCSTKLIQNFRNGIGVLDLASRIIR